MERRGADKYPAAFVQKTYKELEAAGSAVLDNTDDAESSAAAAAVSGKKDTDGADGSKTSNGAKKTAKAKKTAVAKDMNEANEDVVVKEEEMMADGDDDA